MSRLDKLLWLDHFLEQGVHDGARIENDRPSLVNGVAKGAVLDLGTSGRRVGRGHRILEDHQVGVVLLGLEFGQQWLPSGRVEGGNQAGVEVAAARARRHERAIAQGSFPKCSGG